MPRPIVDLSGQRFGHRVVLHFLERENRKTLWLCICDCGNEHIASTGSLRTSPANSCGCITIKHGQTQTPEYKIWSAMLQRCHNPKSPVFKYYGQRGILVCERWHEFKLFDHDIGPRPSSKHTIERFDNSRGYNPCNTYWATRHAQDRNKRSNRMLTFEKKTMCVSDWAAHIGIKRATLNWRLNNGWSIERALSEL